MAERTCQLCTEPLRSFERGMCRGCERENGYDDYEPTWEEKEEAEALYLRSQARAEWDHYHPGEPCPEIELPPRPATNRGGENG